MQKITDYARTCQAGLLRKFWPKLAIVRYCLKSNPRAALFLPGAEAELKVISGVAPGYKQYLFLRDRIWSEDTRKALYQRGLWFILEVGNQWEFEYLLKNTVPVLYLNESKSDFRRQASYEPIVNAMAENKAYAVFMAEQYPKVAENLGAANLAFALPEETYAAMVDALARRIPQRVAPFAAYLDAASLTFDLATAAVLESGGSLLPMMAALFAERDDLYQMIKQRTAEKPQAVVLSAAFQFLLGELKRGRNPERAAAEFTDWLALLEDYLKQSGTRRLWLVLLQQGLGGVPYPQLQREAARLMETYVPNLLNPASRLRTLSEAQVWP